MKSPRDEDDPERDEHEIRKARAEDEKQDHLIAARAHRSRHVRRARPELQNAGVHYQIPHTMPAKNPITTPMAMSSSAPKISA